MSLPGLEVVEHTPGILRGLLDAAGREDLDWQPAPDRWSITMVLAHLADVEVKGFVQRFRAMAAADGAFLPFYDQMALFQSGTRFEGAEQLDRFEKERRLTVAWLKTLPETIVERRGRHEELGDITFGELLHEFAFHDLGHLRQVAEIYRSRVYYPRMGAFQRYYKINP